MPRFLDLIPVSSVPVQPFTWPPVPWQLPDGQQDSAARRGASMPTSPAFGWAPASDDPAGSPTYPGGHDRSSILGASPDADDPARIARLTDAQDAYKFALWLASPASRGPAQRTRELTANPDPSTNTPAIPIAATAVAPPQRAGAAATPAWSAPPRSRYSWAQHGIDAGPLPMDRNEALARTENTRRLASEGWDYGVGGPPIIPHRFVGPETKFSSLPDWAQQDARALWNVGTVPASVLDTTLRTARGAYLGALGGVAGALGDVGLESNPDGLARALPETINVIGAATAQPELTFLPRFPVSTAVRFAVKHPVEAVAGTAEPYLFNRPQLVRRDAGAVGGAPTQPAAVAAPSPRATAFETAPKPGAPFPQYATEYPPVGPPTLVRKADGKRLEGVSESDAQRLVDAGEAYWKKTLKPEVEEFAKQRLAIMREMEQNGYTPYFDPAQRFHVDPANYPTAIDTTRDALPKKQRTIDKYTAMMDTPGGRARLQAAYDAGRAIPGSDNWFAMGQIEDAFIRELGLEEGRAAFKRRFADGMAATTAGADPRSNYLMSQYGNYLDVNGLPTPPSHQLPYPIGGRYAGSNIGMFDRTVRNPEWTGFDANNPKRHDYSYSFLGHRDKFVTDEKITGAILPGHQAPPGKSYGIGAGIGHDLATQIGVSPSDFQDAAWAALNRHYQGPMINHINDAIERTHRLNGMPRDEIVRRGIVLGEIPIYGLGGAAIGLPWLSSRSDKGSGS